MPMDWKHRQRDAEAEIVPTYATRTGLGCTVGSGESWYRAYFV